MHRPSITAVTALVFSLCGAHALAADVACASLLADEVVSLSGESVARYRAMSLARGSDPGIADIAEVAKAVAKITGAKTVYIAAKLTFRSWRSDNEVLVGVGVYGNAGQTLARDTAVAPFAGAAILQYDAAGRLEARHDVVEHRTYSASLDQLENAHSPWDVLSETELAKALDELLFASVYDGTRTLLK